MCATVYLSCFTALSSAIAALCCPSVAVAAGMKLGIVCKNIWVSEARNSLIYRCFVAGHEMREMPDDSLPVSDKFPASGVELDNCIIRPQRRTALI